MRVLFKRSVDKTLTVGNKLRLLQGMDEQAGGGGATYNYREPVGMGSGTTGYAATDEDESRHMACPRQKASALRRASGRGEIHEFGQRCVQAGPRRLVTRGRRRCGRHADTPTSLEHLIVIIVSLWAAGQPGLKPRVDSSPFRAATAPGITTATAAVPRCGQSCCILSSSGAGDRRLCGVVVPNRTGARQAAAATMTSSPPAAPGRVNRR